MSLDEERDPFKLQTEKANKCQEEIHKKQTNKQKLTQYGCHLTAWHLNYVSNNLGLHILWLHFIRQWHFSVKRKIILI